MRNYCTLFDSNYLTKGLVLYESLMRHSSEPFTLHILCTDNETLNLLDEMKLPNVQLMALPLFERALYLKPVRESRSWQEYMWTLASSLMEYLLHSRNEVTYCDADIAFFSDPQVIYEEMADKSIGITPHRFNEREERRLGKNGKYNVGIVVAKNTAAGRSCIARWAQRTRKWCFARNEDGKFGDQAYLDGFPEDYPGKVCIIQNLGVNLGPWSIGNFEITERNGKVFVNDDQLVAYHYHEFRDANHLTNWKLRNEDRNLIYAPYVLWIHLANAAIDAAKSVIDRRQRELEHQMERA